jgi:hypothetical protein
MAKSIKTNTATVSHAPVPASAPTAMVSYADVVKYGNQYRRMIGFEGSFEDRKNHIVTNGLMAYVTLDHNEDDFLSHEVEFVDFVDPLCGSFWADQLRAEGWSYHISMKEDAIRPPDHVFSTWNRKLVLLRFTWINPKKFTALMSQEDNDHELVDLINTYSDGRWCFPDGVHIEM